MSADPLAHVAYRLPSPPRPAGALPPVHEALLADETPYELYNGRLTRVASANPPHAIRHTEVAFVLRANTAPGYISALDLKTRVDENSEVAPDASIYRADIDPETAGRRLEELVVEVTGRQSFSLLTRKAKKLSARGVRRIFCVRVKRREVMEWLHADAKWSPPLVADAVINDTCLVRPMAALALLDAAAADDEAARGLIARKAPAMMTALDAARDEGRAQGVAQGLAQAVMMVLQARGVAVSDAEHRAIVACTDEATLREWTGRAATVATARDLLEASRSAKQPKRA